MVIENSEDKIVLIKVHYGGNNMVYFIKVYYISLSSTPFSSNNQTGHKYL